MIQDIIIGIIQFQFLLFLLPSIFSDNKPDFKTCIMTAIGLTIVGICFGTLELWLSMFGVISAAFGWWILTIQTKPK